MLYSLLGSFEQDEFQENLAYFMRHTLTDFLHGLRPSGKRAIVMPIVFCQVMMDG